MSRFIMLVGLPASGKSKIAEQYKNEFGFKIHSSDKIRDELYGNSQDQSNHGVVFEMLHKRVIKDLKEGNDVVYDATNISAKRRVAFLNRIKRLGCRTTAEVLATPYNMCIERDKKRDAKVGENVIWKMLLNWQMPNYSEGWDDINIGYAMDIDYDFYNEVVKKSFEIPQLNKHHTLTIGKHMASVAANALINEEDIAFIGACMCHDIGKMFTQRFIKSNGMMDIESHFYNHESVSAYMAMFILKTLGVDNVIKACNIIQYHMQPHFDLSDKAKKKRIDIMGLELWNDIHRFNQYDKSGR